MTDERDSQVRRSMQQHTLYTYKQAGLESLEEERFAGKELAHEYNHTGPRELARRQDILTRLLGSIGERVWVEPPLRVAYGRHIHIGDDTYINFGVTFFDDADIIIGDRVMIAPNVTITTTGHSVHPDLRAHGEQFSAPIRIEDDAWIGAGATLIPGITIGAGSVIGAGSIVTTNVPTGVIAAGTPARILRPITESDKDFHYRPPRTLTHNT